MSRRERERQMGCTTSKGKVDARAIDASSETSVAQTKDSKSMNSDVSKIKRTRKTKKDKAKDKEQSRNSQQVTTCNSDDESEEGMWL